MRVGLGLKPFGAQLRGLESPDRFVFVGGGWGSGKTGWLCMELLRCAAANPNSYSLVVSPSYRLQRRTVMTTIEELLAPTVVGRRARWPIGYEKARETLGPLARDWSAGDLCLTWWTGHRTYFASADVPGSLEGVNVCAVFVDEGRLIRRSAWEIASARVRDTRSAMLRRCVSSVPVHGWLWDEFGRGVDGRTYLQARTRDNPFLPPSYADDLAATLSPQMARAYLDGEFVVLEGLVFWTYDPTPACDGGSLLPVRTEPGRPTYGVLDFGGRSPYFGLSQDIPVIDTPRGVEVATAGRMVECATDEIVMADQLSVAHAQAVADLCIERGVVLSDVYCDPAGRARNDQTGLADVAVYRSVLQSAGVLRGSLRWPSSLLDRHIPNGVEVLRARLQSATGQRSFFVAEHLTEGAHTGRMPRGHVGIHGALTGYRYPENRPGSDEPLKDGIHDHAADSWRYGAVCRWGVSGRLKIDLSAANQPAEASALPWASGIAPTEWSSTRWDGSA